MFSKKDCPQISIFCFKGQRNGKITCLKLANNKDMQGTWLILFLQFEQVFTTEAHIKMFENDFNNVFLTTKIIWI